MTIRLVELGEASFLVVGRYWIPTRDMDIDMKGGAEGNSAVITRLLTGERIPLSEVETEELQEFFDRMEFGGA